MTGLMKLTPRAIRVQELGGTVPRPARGTGAGRRREVRA